MANPSTGATSSGPDQTPQRNSSATFTGSANVPAPSTELISPYMMSAEDCSAMFSGADRWESLDLYFIDRCNPNNRLLIKAEHYTEDGVKFMFKYDGDMNTSGSPSDEYYVVKKASVEVDLTIRNGMDVPDIKSFIMLGEETQTSTMRVHTMSRANTIRKRPPNYVMIAVPEGEPPTPETVGGYLFPNITIDMQSGLTLTHNAKDYQESQVKFLAKFSRGKNGVLSKVYIPK
jgi:hypothetical protein